MMSGANANSFYYIFFIRIKKIQIPNNYSEFKKQPLMTLSQTSHLFKSLFGQAGLFYIF